MNLLKKDHSSFRDPSGFIFEANGKLLRQVSLFYKENYDYLMHSGLYKELTSKNLLVFHKKRKEKGPYPKICHKVIEPERIPFISYPYEWCFSQLKDAALLTLKIQKIALQKGMVLKDASAFNIQFIGKTPIFIDTLSFERYKANTPWVAYRQFCEHFLAPLSLMHYKDVSFNKTLRVFLDGIPLSLVSKLLPRSTYFRFSLLSHIHIHSRVQTYFGGKRKANYDRKLSKAKLLTLIESLEQAVRALHWEPKGTQWAEYYDDTNYSDKGFENKKKEIEAMIREVSPKTVWDIGANKGAISKLASNRKIRTVAFDIDPAATEKNYLDASSNNDKRYLLPLIMDITNPSPGLGWNLSERHSLPSRGPADMVIAVAFIHHLAIGGNAPLEMVARFFRSIGKTLVVEFVPKEDSQVARLLASREDIFFDYTQKNFEKQFTKYFKIKKKVPLADSERILYLMV